MRRLSLLLPLILLTAIACSTKTADPTPAAPAPPTEDPPADDTPDPRLDKRPYTVHVPKGYDGTTPLPLVFAFHGYGDDDDGAGLDHFFKFSAAADAEKFLYIAPDGIEDKGGQRFWNGTDACCDFDGLKPDDVGYVRAIVADVAKKYPLDPKRVYAFGLSGGGFFVHRLACDAPDVFAAVLSMSGATYADASKCKPAEPIAVAELHGTKDENVDYAGGELDFGGPGVVYPGAKETVAHWATYNGCTGALTDTTTTYDLFPTVSGSETTVAKYDCPKGAVELWTATDGTHAPAIGPSFAKTAWSFFSAHPKM